MLRQTRPRVGCAAGVVSCAHSGARGVRGVRRLGVDTPTFFDAVAAPAKLVAPQGWGSERVVGVDLEQLLQSAK